MSGEEKKRSVTMVAVLVGLLAVVVVGVMCYRPPGRKPGVRLATDAVVVSPIWGERHLKYLGKSNLDGGRKWTQDETTEVEGGRSTTLGFTRVSRFEAGGIQMVLVLSSENNVRSILCRQPWVGDGEYTGTLTDERTGAKSEVTVRVELPPIQD